MKHSSTGFGLGDCLESDKLGWGVGWGGQVAWAVRVGVGVGVHFSDVSGIV